MLKGRKETATVLVAARASTGDLPESAIASSLRPVQLSWGSDECNVARDPIYQVYEAHLPATLTFLRIRSIASSETPSPSIVAFPLLNSRPSYEILCSATGIPDLSQRKDLSLGDTLFGVTHFGLKQSHDVLKFHLWIYLDNVGLPQIRHEC